MLSSAKAMRKYLYILSLGSLNSCYDYSILLAFFKRLKKVSHKVEINPSFFFLGHFLRY